MDLLDERRHLRSSSLIDLLDGDDEAVPGGLVPGERLTDIADRVRGPPAAGVASELRRPFHPALY